MLSLGSLILHFLNKQNRSFAAFIPNAKHHTNTCRNSANLLEMVKSVIPPLTYDWYKGQAGKIGVVGGCKEYTGAPYFAAISVMKMGADLSHVFCANEAAPVIKSYSPELIVHPILDHPKFIEEMNPWLQKMHCIVIGPGLGRHDSLMANVKYIIEEAKQLDKPLIIDADGVFLLNENPDLINGYKKAILTPNRVEFKRLYEVITGNSLNADEPVASVVELSRAMGNVTVVRKGENDIISDGENVLVCCNEGSPRRCGGQGDLLSGSMGVISAWAHQLQNTDNELFNLYGPTITAAYGACYLTRECNRMAFKINGRSTNTVDMIAQIHNAFTNLFE